LGVREPYRDGIRRRRHPEFGASPTDRGVTYTWVSEGPGIERDPGIEPVYEGVEAAAAAAE
jgi:hypothetical protein